MRVCITVRGPWRPDRRTDHLTRRNSSDEDEFDVELLRNEIDRIHKRIIDRENKNSDGVSGTILGTRNQKITIIDSESKRDSDAPHDSNNLKWTACEESSKTPSRIKFITGEKPAGPQVSSNVQQHFLRYLWRRANKSNNN